MTRPPPRPPGPPGPPPGWPPTGPPDRGRPRDPRGKLLRIRNAIIVSICVLAVGAMVTTFALDGGFRTPDARNYIQTTYTRAPSLDEAGIQAYVADGNPTAVASEIAESQKPTDRLGGLQEDGNTPAMQFLQYPDYLVAVFPYGTNQSRVMVSKDYRSGYNHYHSYVGLLWVPTPSYSGPGSGYRGGGSGSGK